jgi:hypothetical protein
MKKRVQLDLSEASYQQLLQLIEKSDCHSMAEATRKAIKLFLTYLQRREEGYRLYYQKGNMKERVEIL